MTGRFDGVCAPGLDDDGTPQPRRRPRRRTRVYSQRLRRSNRNVTTTPEPTPLTEEELNRAQDTARHFARVECGDLTPLARWAATETDE